MQNSGLVNTNFVFLDDMARKPVFKTPLGQRIAEVREKAGKSRDELALMLGNVSASAIANYERGENAPDAAVLARYRECLEVNLNWLICGEGDMVEVAGGGLKEPEAELLLKFRQLPTVRQELVLDTLDFNLERARSE